MNNVDVCFKLWRKALLKTRHLYSFSNEILITCYYATRKFALYRILDNENVPVFLELFMWHIVRIKELYKMRDYNRILHSIQFCLGELCLYMHFMGTKIGQYAWNILAVIFQWRKYLWFLEANEVKNKICRRKIYTV